MADRVAEAVMRGTKCIIGDSPNRPGRPAFLRRLSDLLGRDIAFETVKGMGVVGARHDLISTSTPTSDNASEGSGRDGRNGSDGRNGREELVMGLLEL